MAVSGTTGDVRRCWSLHRRPAEPADNYEAVAFAGGGSFAEVWKVRDVRGQVFALKQLRPEWQEHRTARRLLENEAEIGRRVESPHLVRVVDAQLRSTPPFLVLDWLEGESLEQRLQRTGRVVSHTALWIARQCVSALLALQTQGLIHGDLKPGNVFLERSGNVRLIDLGFARPAGASPEELTGTPEYLAPEVLAGEASGRGRDVYSLGVILYRMLSGRLPFHAGTVSEVLERQQQDLVVPLRTLAPDVPREIASLVERLLSKQPLRRSLSLTELHAEIIALEVGAVRAELRHVISA